MSLRQLYQRIVPLKLRDYISKQFRFSLGNSPSVIVGTVILYLFTQFGGLWYIYSSWVSFVVAVFINFNMQRYLKVIATIGWTDYASKLGRFYFGSGLMIPVSTGLLYAITEYGHIWYLISSLLVLLVTTILNMGLQIAMKVVTMKSSDS